MAVVASLLALVSLYQRARVVVPAHHARPFDVLTPQATPLAHAYVESPEEEEPIPAGGSGERGVAPGSRR